MEYASIERAYRQAIISPKQPRPPAHDTAARKWHCSQCRQAFKKKGHLVRHTQSHTKQKPFACSQCPRAYSRQDSLVRHERTHISDQQGPKGTVNVDTEVQILEDSAIYVNVGSHGSQTPRLHPCPLVSQDSSSISESITSETMPLDADSSELFTQSHHYSPDSTWDELPQFTSAQLSGLVTTDTLWVNNQFNLQTLSSAILGADCLTNANEEQVFATSQTAPPSANDQAFRVTPGVTNTTNRIDVFQAVKSRWYTHPVPESSTPQPYVRSTEHGEVNEEYRAGLSTRLAPNLEDITLPSADFLNLCVKLYFTKFHPLFPIIHPASFRPTSDRALVLLSICSIGALFVGSEGASQCGRAIFTRLNKAILASWERYIYQGGREALAVAQAATLGQTYGILSGRPNDLLLTESFHGTIIAWARQAGIFRVRTSRQFSSSSLDVNDIEGSWKRWAEREETLRLVLALQIHDSEFSKIFHHEGLLRHDHNKLPACCSAELFAAKSAFKWHALVTATPQTAFCAERLAPVAVQRDTACKDPFYAYALLAGHYAQLSEARCRDSFEDQAGTIRQHLTTWHEDVVGSIVEPHFDPLGLMGLWHQSFMALYVDFDFLERIIGRDGTPPTRSEENEIRRWVHSNDGIRCALHATLMIEHHGTQAISAESAIHVPLGLFYAGIIIYCYIRFAEMPMQEIVEVVELRRSETSSIVVMEQMDSKALYAVTDILRRQGHWGLSRRLASILEVLVEESLNMEMR